MVDEPSPPGGIRWDQTATRTQPAGVASAASAGGAIVISFGQRYGDDAPGQPQGVSLVRRIALQPMTAKNLHDMLSRLLAEQRPV